MTTETVAKTHTAAILPILIALEKFKDLGISRFIPGGENEEEQALLLSLLPEARTVQYREGDIKAFASTNIAELNRILKEHGFDIRLSEGADLGVVTIMDLIASWLSKAIETTLQYESKTYPALIIKEGASVVQTISGTELLMIRTKNGISIFIEKTEQETSGLELFMHARSVSKTLLHTEEPCDATIPFVTIDQQPDISWITGMSGVNTPFYISQALQQNRLKINLDGVHAESAVAVAMRKGISLDERRGYVVDTPFNIWLSYSDTDFPLFAAHVMPENWKK